MNIFETVQRIVSQQFSVDAERITESTDFQDELGADSLDVVELAVSVEDEFGIGEIAEEDILKIHTVGDLVDYLRRVLD
ncbi:MAG: acyl carrier protein [Oscillospiraceae bacterium]|nr:acyl carrier protein [Oscillospiraceae bacterium]MBQ2634181.1 acyl carrier protein [Oscillospiraceae bacterium]MBR3084401.1 acyl carrier protein [Oscillospiraceae bacterium]MBR3861634.1 acyl carrier protein [Oscillospiraceae bacterium]MBR6097083.1 acyl carrier protein [Oscillospiraceae bacterium]